MAHKALEGEVMNGKHEKIVSKATFLEENNITAEKKLGLQNKKEIPLPPYQEVSESFPPLTIKLLS